MSFLKSALDRLKAQRGHAVNPRSLAERVTTAVNLIQTPDIGRKLVTRFGIREKAPSPTLSAEVVPVVLVDDLVGESDLIRPRIKPASGGTQFAMPGVLYGFVGLYNPLGSRNILHLYYYSFTGAAMSYRISLGSKDIAANPSGASRQGFRNGLFAGEVPGGQLMEGAAVAQLGGTDKGFLNAPAAATHIVPFDAVLDEGQGFWISQTTPAVANVNCMFVWSEEAKHN